MYKMEGKKATLELKTINFFVEAGVVLIFAPYWGYSSAG